LFGDRERLGQLVDRRLAAREPRDHGPPHRVAQRGERPVELPVVRLVNRHLYQPTGLSTSALTMPDGRRSCQGGAGKVDRVTAAAEIFDEHRQRLWGVAYRVLGRVNDVEDVIQDT